MAAANVDSVPFAAASSFGVAAAALHTDVAGSSACLLGIPHTSCAQGQLNFILKKNILKMLNWNVQLSGYIIFLECKVLVFLLLNVIFNPYFCSDIIF